MSYANDKSYVNVPVDKINDFVKKAFEISRPQGMGILHFSPNDTLSDEMIQSNLTNNEVALSFDYLAGRAMKFRLFKEKGLYYFCERWFDHTEEDVLELLSVLD